MMAGETLPECEVCNDQLLNTDVYRTYFWHLFKHKYDDVIGKTDLNDEISWSVNFRLASMAISADKNSFAEPCNCFCKERLNESRATKPESPNDKFKINKIAKVLLLRSSRSENFKSFKINRVFTVIIYNNNFLYF
jgi:hypothetical protein